MTESSLSSQSVLYSTQKPSSDCRDQHNRGAVKLGEDGEAQAGKTAQGGLSNKTHSTGWKDIWDIPWSGFSVKILHWLLVTYLQRRQEVELHTPWWSFLKPNSTERFASHLPACARNPASSQISNLDLWSELVSGLGSLNWTPIWQTELLGVRVESYWQLICVLRFQGGRRGYWLGVSVPQKSVHHPAARTDRETQWLC